MKKKNARFLLILNNSLILRNNIASIIMKRKSYFALYENIFNFKKILKHLRKMKSQDLYKMKM